MHHHCLQIIAGLCYIFHMGEKRGSRLPKPDERQVQEAATESSAPLTESVEHGTG